MSAASGRESGLEPLLRLASPTSESESKRRHGGGDGHVVHHDGPAAVSSAAGGRGPPIRPGSGIDGRQDRGKSTDDDDEKKWRGEGGPVRPTEYRVYARRWWVLFLLCLTSLQSGYVWLTFSTVETHVRHLYGWSKETIFLLGAWSPVIYLPVVLITPRLVEAKGLRWCIVYSAVSVSVACIARSVTTASPFALILAHASQITNAAAGPLLLATPQKLSSDFFAPHERTFATSVGVMANYLGAGVGFLCALPVHTDHDVRHLLWGQATFSVVIAVLCLLDAAFFPALPPTPPSASSTSAQSVDFLSDIRGMLANRQFMLLAVAYGVSAGTYSGWSGVLYPILEPLHFSQTTASWLGFASIIGTVVGGVGFGYLGDRAIRSTKTILVALYIAATAAFLWFALLANGTISRSPVQLFVSCILGSLMLNGAAALFYEAAVEVCYPINHVAAGGILTFAFCAASAVYMLIGPLFHHHNNALNWILAGTCGFGLVSLLFFRNDQRRLAVDMVLLDESQLVPLEKGALGGEGSK